MPWQPIETAPKDREIIVWEGFEPRVSLAMWDEEYAEWLGGPRSFWKHPTHWMPYEPPVT